MKICVLQPDYSTTMVDYKDYDPPRDLSSLLPGSTVHHVFLNKLTTYRQLKQLATEGYDCFVNLCEGYLDWEIPSIDVIYTLQLLDLPFTGPTTQLYDPPKEVMKYVAYTEDVLSPAYAKVCKGEDVTALCKHLTYPLFVKPAHAGDSLGIDEHSLVNDTNDLLEKVDSLWADYNEVLVEEFIDGKEFTVLLVADPASPKSSIVFTPLEYVFPADRKFKTYALKTSELHPECNFLVKDEALATSLQQASQRIFSSFGGVGYGRLDFRMDKEGRLFFLEINFTCSVFYTNGYEGSADYIIKNEPIGQSGFLRLIIDEGMARYQRKKKKYALRGNAIAGFGIYATTAITQGEVIFKGEAEEHRLVTARHVHAHWNEVEKKAFEHYAFPLSEAVYEIWDKEPCNWAPQNHSCEPNTGYDGLNVIALREIKTLEELTLDYETFLDDSAASFTCHCGTVSCRGTIKATKGNTLTQRENLRLKL